MKKNNLPFKAFVGLFLAGWLVGLFMSPLLHASPALVTSESTGTSVGVISPAPEQLSFWDKLGDSFLDLWFSIPDAFRWSKSTFNYSAKLPPGIAKITQEICQQEKQNTAAMIARLNEIASQNSAQLETSIAKSAADAIKTMTDSTKQGADWYRQHGYERYAQNLETSQQRYNLAYQEMLATQKKAREEARQATIEFWQSYLETRFNC